MIEPRQVLAGSYYLGRHKKDRGVSVMIVLDYDASSSRVAFREIGYWTGTVTGKTQTMRFNKFKRWVRARVVVTYKVTPGAASNLVWRVVENYYGSTGREVPDRLVEDLTDEEFTAMMQRTSDKAKQADGKEDDVMKEWEKTWSKQGRYQSSSGYLEPAPKVTIDVEALLEIPVLAHWNKHVQIASGWSHDRRSYGYGGVYHGGQQGGGGGGGGGYGVWAGYGSHGAPSGVTPTTPPTHVTPSAAPTPPFTQRPPVGGNGGPGSLWIETGDGRFVRNPNIPFGSGYDWD